MRTLILAVAYAGAVASAIDPARPIPWQDPSKHEVTFVTVEPGVRLEALDWGGRGRPIVLLAGSGHSAHVYDDLGPKLTEVGHVYAITRRGYGASSQPESGYDEQRLADDIVRVLDALKIEEPVLVGHSMAGGELTTIGTRHSKRLGGLVYLDALGDPTDWPASDPAYRALLAKLPPPRPRRCPEDRDSFAGYREWQMCTQGFAFPEAELRNGFATREDGGMGAYKTPRRIHEAIGAGARKRDYSRITVPVLLLCELPQPPEAPPGPDEAPKNDEERAAIAEFRKATKAYVDRGLANLRRGAPQARIVDLPGAGHFVFLTREAEVLRELRAFVAALADAEGSRR